MGNPNTSATRRSHLKSGVAMAPLGPQAPDIDTAHTIVPLAVKPKVASRLLSCGLTRLYELLANGELTSYLDGRSRLITVESIRAYVAKKIAAAANSAPRTPETA